MVEVSQSRRSRFFVALLPPQPIQDQVTAIKQEVADRYESRGALRSPPHITVQPPFEWAIAEVSNLQAGLQAFANRQRGIPITLSGFGAFPPRVIYVNVLRSSELLALHQALIEHCEASFGLLNPVEKQRPYAPHMTVAFRDLARQQFRIAWPEFELRSFAATFTATHLTLLIHDGQRWQVHSEFPFATGELNHA